MLLGYLFFEVSAKDGTNVQDVFASLVKDVKGKIIDNPPPKQKESEKKGNQARFKVIFLGTSCMQTSSCSKKNLNS